MAASKKSDTKKITTLQFGNLSVEKKYIYTFNDGILGFEDLKEFVLISEEETLPFKWLISVDKPEIGFPLLSPWLIDLTYDPGKDFDMQKQLLMVVITLQNEKGMMTANMKAPIVFEIAEQTGSQVILPSDKFSPTFVIPVNKNEK